MKPAQSTARTKSPTARATKEDAPLAPEGALLFLTGWPACGLSEYGAWLAANRGYRHLDLDDDSSADAALRAAWAERLPGSAPRLIRELLTHADRWVITGERPADHLPHLGALRDAGIGVWFLQPQLDSHSRQRWMARERERGNEPKPGTWEKLADAIRRNARALRPHFRNRCVHALAAEGQLSFEVMAEAMHIPAPEAGRSG